MVTQVSLDTKYTKYIAGHCISPHQTVALCRQSW